MQVTISGTVFIIATIFSCLLAFVLGYIGRRYQKSIEELIKEYDGLNKATSSLIETLSDKIVVLETSYKLLEKKHVEVINYYNEVMPIICHDVVQYHLDRAIEEQDFEKAEQLRKWLNLQNIHVTESSGK